ncbi:MAG TPA: hypothetical protein VI893_03230 [Thermoplasmata archaeon]|nr:hypothetical protein [Thermoplasmata archaeon]
MRLLLPLDGEWFLSRRGLHRFPATVPGNVLTALHKRGHLPDPHDPANRYDSLAAWRHEWRWGCSFSADVEGRNLWRLIFKGLSGKGRVVLNDRIVPVKDGMADVSSLIAVENQVEVRFAPRLGKYDSPARLRHLSSTDGITDHVFVKGATDAIIEVMLYRPRFHLGKWRLDIFARIFSNKRQTVDLVVSLQRKQELHNESSRVELAPGVNLVRRSFGIGDVDRWDPWDLGEQTTYAVVARLMRGGDELDGHTDFVGFREARWPTSHLMINGRAEYVRGAEWEPVNVFRGEVGDRDYVKLLHLALKGNLNLLRVGFKEKEEFYTTCDSLGILVWQSQPNSSLPRATLHPSVALLPEGSDNDPWLHGSAVAAGPGVDESLLMVEAERAPSQSLYPLLVPATKARRRERQQVIFERQQAQAYLLQREVERARLLRRGPAGRVVRLGDTGLQLRDPREEMVHLMGFGADMAGDGTTAPPDPAIFETDEGSPGSAGVVVKRFNDPEPCVSSSVVDFFGNRKLAFHKLSQVYSVLAAFIQFRREPGNEIEGRLWIVNDVDQEFKGTYVQVVFHNNVEESEIVSGILDIPKKALLFGGAFRFGNPGEHGVVRTRLVSRGYILAENNYDLRRVGYMDKKKTGRATNPAEGAKKPRPPGPTS